MFADVLLHDNEWQQSQSETAYNNIAMLHAFVVENSNNNQTITISSLLKYLLPFNVAFIYDYFIIRDVKHANAQNNVAQGSATILARRTGLKLKFFRGPVF